MKNPITPTRDERQMKPGDFIVSKTDTKGRITYCNEILIAMSGYREEELLGAHHNIIRHPDMPRGVFGYLWQTITAGKECFAYVKNLAKDGSFYWVFANVTPDYDPQGRISGFFSVRRKPRAEAVRAVEGLYAAMLEEERKAGPREAIAASTRYLTDALNAKRASYDQFILSL